jgi:broad specificity phosphatase PhoE
MIAVSLCKNTFIPQTFCNMSSITLQEVNDVENEIQIAQEKQDKARVRKNNHLSNTVEKRLVEIEKAKNNLPLEPTFIPRAKKYVCSNSVISSDNKINTKVIHFVRHGEGHHNLLAKQIGRKAYMDPSVFDPKLTDTGKLQAAALQDEILNLCLNDMHSIDCIVFSPMQRALMTGAIACKKIFSTYGKKSLPKMIVLECVRERYGVHICDSRRPIDVIEKEYPDIDFTNIEYIEDKLHDEKIRETHEHLIERGYEFLDWLQNQDDSIKSVLVFSHSSYLMNMFNAVLKFEQTDEEHNDIETISTLKKWFNTGEMKSVKIEFQKT